MTTITLKELVMGTKDCEGVIIRFSPQAFRTVCYFLREFAVPTDDPFDQLGAFGCGGYLVVGTRYFRDDFCKAFHLLR